MYHLEINIDGTKQNSIEAGFTVPGAQSALWARKTFFICNKINQHGSTHCIK
jgi:hypothetical protein